MSLSFIMTVDHRMIIVILVFTITEHSVPGGRVLTITSVTSPVKENSRRSLNSVTSRGVCYSVTNAVIGTETWSITRDYKDNPINKYMLLPI